VIEYTSTGRLQLATGVKVLVYGNAGIGKTMLCATAPKPLLISAEGGLLSLQRKNIERVFGVNTPGITYDIPVALIRTVEDLMRVYDDVKRPDWSANIQTVCLDSLSEIAETVLAHAHTQTKDGRAAFGDMAEQVLELCRKFRDLPGKHVYFSTKQGFSTDSDLIGPSLPGRMLDREIPYLFDELLQLGISQDAQGQAFRYLRTMPDLKHYAKDRSGMLDARGECPSLTNIFNKISAGA
jgi:AAA domain